MKPWKIVRLEGSFKLNMGVSKNRGKTPKMDGENNGKPYFLMDDLGYPYCSTRTSWWLNHPFEKYARQNGAFPQIGMKIKKI